SVCAPARFTQVAASASTSLNLPVTARTHAPPSSASVRRRFKRTPRSDIPFVFIFIQFHFLSVRRFGSAGLPLLNLVRRFGPALCVFGPIPPPNVEVKAIRVPARDG